MQSWSVSSWGRLLCQSKSIGRHGPKRRFRLRLFEGQIAGVSMLVGDSSRMTFCYEGNNGKHDELE
jgi:hypothetical protein